MRLSPLIKSSKKSKPRTADLNKFKRGLSEALPTEWSSLSMFYRSLSKSSVIWSTVVTTLVLAEYARCVMISLVNSSAISTLDCSIEADSNVPACDTPASCSNGVPDSALSTYEVEEISCKFVGLGNVTIGNLYSLDNVPFENRAFT